MQSVSPKKDDRYLVGILLYCTIMSCIDNHAQCCCLESIEGMRELYEQVIGAAGGSQSIKKSIPIKTRVLFFYIILIFWAVVSSDIIIYLWSCEKQILKKNTSQFCERGTLFEPASGASRPPDKFIERQACCVDQWPASNTTPPPHSSIANIVQTTQQAFYEIIWP